MKVAELKEELEARDEAKSGNKAWLRRRLHAAIVRDHLAASADDRGERGGILRFLTAPNFYHFYHLKWTLATLLLLPF